MMDTPTNSDFVEGIDYAQHLHRTINELVWKYGAGSPVAVVWSQRDSERERILTGTVVTQCQYGQKAYRFSVHYDNDHYRLNMLRHSVTVKSDYFAP